MNTFRLAATCIALISLLSGCASTPSMDVVAHAEIGPASGSQVKGRAIFTRIAGGLHLAITVRGLTPGEHGFHIHEVGDCSAPDATSAKGHYNPGGARHGGQGGEHHAGDMTNLMADSNGNATFSADLMGLGVGAGNDVVGRALVIHADPDDYKSQPAGNSGKRVACGVIKVG